MELAHYILIGILILWIINGLMNIIQESYNRNKMAKKFNKEKRQTNPYE